VGPYTAWALALGQSERWSVLAAARAVRAGSAYDEHHLRFVTYSPFLTAGCASASVSPSSSSSGGGGGGSVGGGSGGGGGGSW
jgi:uncharacterized membrane protein